jgi:hypothetical protein
MMTTTNHGDDVGDGDDASQECYGDDTLERSGRGNTTHAGGQEVLTCRSEAREVPGEAQRQE